MYELLKSLWDQVDVKLQDYRREAEELRDIDVPTQISTASTLHDLITTYRRSQDRLEAILAELGLVRSRVRIIVTQAQYEFDDAWQKAANNSRTGEYSSAKERDAAHTAHCIDELIRLRKAKQMLADVEEVYDYVQIKHRGIDGARRDIDTRIRAINLASNLER